MPIIVENSGEPSIGLPTGGNTGLIDGVTVSKINKWIENKTINGRILKFLYDNRLNKNISFEELKNGIDYDGSDSQFKNNMRNGCGLNAKYGKLWIYKNRLISINQNIIQYITQ